MTTLIIDGFDHYDNDQAPMYWPNRSDFSTWISITTAAAHTGRAGVRKTAWHASLSRLLPGGSYSELCVAFWWRWTTVANSQYVDMIGLEDDTSQQIGLEAHGLNHVLRVTRAGADISGDSTFVFDADTWYHIALRVVVDNTNGEVELRINGAVEFNLTGLDTQATANATANRIRIGQVAGTNVMPAMDWDDLVVTDGPFPGQTRVATLAPNGNGTYSDFVGSDADSTDNYALVDEEPQDDVDYVETVTVNDKDSYAVADLVGAASVVAVSHEVRMLKTDAGDRVARSFLRRGSTDYEGPDYPVTDSAKWASTVWDDDPSTSAAWTPAGVAATEIGVKLHG